MVAVQVEGRVMMIAVGVSVGRDIKAGIVGGGNGFKLLYGLVNTDMKKQATHKTPIKARIERA
jgi:hypothetical protein